jgi:hypothetical protein
VLTRLRFPLPRSFAFAIFRSVSICLIGFFALVAISDLTFGYWAPYTPFEVFFPIRFTVGLICLFVFAILIGLKKYLFALIPFALLIFEVWYTFVAGSEPYPSWSTSSQLEWLYLVGFATSCPKNPATLTTTILNTREGMKLITTTSSCLYGKDVIPISSTRWADIESFYFFLFGSASFLVSRILERKKFLISFFETLVLSSSIITLFTLGIYFFQNAYWKFHVVGFAIPLLSVNLGLLTNESVFEISGITLAFSFVIYILLKRTVPLYLRSFSRRLFRF